MKIAINCSICQPKGGGITEYIVNLAREIERIDHDNEYVLYVLQDLYDFCKTKLPSRFRLKKIPYNNTMIQKIKRSLFSQHFWYQEEKEERFDIFHSPFFYAPKMKRAKVVVTVHDLRLYRFPRTYNLLRYIYLRHSVKETIRRADRIISISEFTKKEIVDTCHINEEKIKVIHEAINREFFNSISIEDYRLPSELLQLQTGRILFSLGHIEPRKNYVRLIEAFKLLKKKKGNEDLVLVIAGKPLLDTKIVFKIINETDDVLYLNYIPHKLLLWLYRNATLFVFPSFYEGFGFPPLEAASMGTVSAVSNVSSIPEVCGDTAFYFNPYDVQEIYRVIDGALSHPESIKEREEKLEEQLSKFSWRKNAQETIEIYKSFCK